MFFWRLSIATGRAIIIAGAGVDYVKSQSIKSEKLVSKKTPKADQNINTGNTAGRQLDRISEQF
jgi:sialic acid synthase SpsE